MKKPRTVRGVALILLLLVFLPLLVFTAFEIARLGAGESAIEDIYNRQLDVVLFSVNQFAWDVVNTWAGSLQRAWEPAPSGGAFAAGFAQKFLPLNSSIDAVFLADTTGETITALATPEGDARRVRKSLGAILRDEKPVIERLLALGRQNYRKIEPVVPASPSGNEKGVVLLFVLRNESGMASIAGIRLLEEKFVREVLGERMRAAAAAEYVLSAMRQADGSRIYSTDESVSAGPELTRQLWLFPDVAVGVRLRGESVRAAAHDRARRDLATLIVLDALLLTGVLVVYWSVRREMEFVRLKSDFVSSVSHDLRTPLALIRMYAETLEMGRLRGERKKREYYSTIVKETERLTRLVNNLLNFSRMEAGRKPYSLVPTDLNAVVRDVMASFAPHIEGRGLTPVVALDAALPRTKADGEAVQEALFNILDNAVKYGADGKYLRVATGTRQGAAWISVEDHGRGVPREYQEKIFETFFRVQSQTEGAPSGSGLGLAIARHIMEAHGGTIELKSEPGGGSLFTLVFPP